MFFFLFCFFFVWYYIPLKSSAELAKVLLPLLDLHLQLSSAVSVLCTREGHGSVVVLLGHGGREGQDVDNVDIGVSLSPSPNCGLSPEVLVLF